MKTVIVPTKGNTELRDVADLEPAQGEIVVKVPSISTANCRIPARN